MNDWTPKKEIQLKSWLTTCETYSIIHEELANNYSSINKYLLIPSIILSAVSSVISGIKVSNNEDNMLNIITLVLSGLVTALITFSQNMKAEQKCETNKTLSKSYKMIYITIETELCYDPEARINANDFIKNIADQLKTLMQNSEHASALALKKIRNTKVEINTGSAMPAKLKHVVELAKNSQANNDEIKNTDTRIPINTDTRIPINTDTRIPINTDKRIPINTNISESVNLDNNTNRDSIVRGNLAQMRARSTIINNNTVINNKTLPNFELVFPTISEDRASYNLDRFADGGE